MAGFFPCPFQSSALYPPALVLHHHLQCGQTPDEEQTAGKGKVMNVEIMIYDKTLVILTFCFFEGVCPR